MVLGVTSLVSAQNSPPVVTYFWLKVDYYRDRDYYWCYCDEYAVIKGRVESYDPDGDPVLYTWYVNGRESGWGDSLWYETQVEGWYEVYVRVEDIYGLSTWEGPHRVKVDFDWYCGGGCSTSLDSEGLGLLTILFGFLVIPLVKKL